MQVEGEESNVGGAKGGGSGLLSISLHPLVIINISDHSTRFKALSSGKSKRVLGVLLGKLEGRSVEVCNSFEMSHKEVEGKIKIDMEYFTIKMEQYKKVFPSLDPVGWYSNAVQRVPVGEVLPGDIDLHREIAKTIENPLYLLLDTTDGAGVRDLPVQMLESEVHMIDDTPTLTFAKSSYHLETEETERVAVDQVSHLLPAGAASASSSMSSHMSSVHSAVKMLQKRVVCILSLLEAMERGEVKKDHRLLRQVASLCQRLPATETGDFKEDFVQHYNDTLLVTYLASMTKGTNSINDLIDKYNVTFERKSHRRGLF
mmetsp:Transcript_104084/g.167720  ORF Transcript_104084/g.167720 Transcript_104084/m.167720 type:complete len:316 (+) Transcript_104084:143-1090(+)